MDVLNITTNKRKELIEFLGDTVSADSLCWIKSCFNTINKNVLGTDDVVLHSRVYTMYNWMKNFFEKFCTEKNEANILISIHMCMEQLGITGYPKLTDTEFFKREVDEEDFKKFDLDAINCTDNNHAMYVNAVHQHGYDKELKILWCGLMTLEMVFRVSK